ncbi:tetratricopeptide repeat protein [Neptunitalea lumnitzerae]|uniref:Tetratricopeptide repeat protein n=1 Tax=Neptunitalea lumnitzerae TaxID=2965509 RepID=A0ABQ5MG76_9FLAO|nr:tetratricopeptide repeat protein [Neptunitalea sp. Y10]GLB48392.1 hypothetical protein Y10_07600 [Neptunitalea sp. Y10]
MKRKWILHIVFVLFTVYGFSQNSQLAKQYFEDGDFDKALAIYKELYDSQPYNNTYLTYLVQCYQQLEQYTEAQEVLLHKLDHSGNPIPLTEIDLGYNYLLQKDSVKATYYFDRTIKYIEMKPEYSGSIGYQFHKYSLLDYALQAYTKGMELKPNLNYGYAIATIYGEQGNVEKMFDTLLDLYATNEQQQTKIRRALAQFITEEPSNQSNQLLKKLLLKRTQSAPDTKWNEILSWLFVQQKQYNMAFIQEKAIYKRTNEISLDRLTDLALAATEDKENATAISIYNFIIEKSNFNGAILEAELAIIKLLSQENPVPEKEIEDKFHKLLPEYGMIPQTVQLHIAYAHFIAFQKNNPEVASEHLKKLLKLNLSVFDEAAVKMELADILVYDQHFNEALIYYSQIQTKLKNDVIGQNAMFKVAQTSFYKGDFKWAENQLKILKSSTSQLIANDALQLMLVITDNSQEDSLQTALKIYAKADLLAYQNKDTEAIKLLDTILTKHKGESIEDEALYKQAKLYEKAKAYDKAIINYEKMLEFFDGGILTDDALFALATIYEYHLIDTDKAKEYYEKIIFNHQDSIYFVAARKAFRKLRGDNLGS